MAKNPYRPGVGTRPPYLAGREQQIHRFQRLLEDYPEKRRNLRVTGLRGVGKTVLLKEYERIAKRHEWVVVRRDWSTRLCDEAGPSPLCWRIGYGLLWRMSVRLLSPRAAE